MISFMLISDCHGKCLQERRWFLATDTIILLENKVSSCSHVSCFEVLLFRFILIYSLVLAI